jgi:outer membrane protein TolC
MFISSRIRILLACSAVSLTLAACSLSGDPVGINEQASTLKQDLAALFGGQEEIAAPLTLSDAMARGIKYNINHRVSAVEEAVAAGDVSRIKAGMLPGLSYEGHVLGRDNPETIEAITPGTGVRTLAPSIFEERIRRTAALEASWDILDASLVYARSRSASDEARAAMERRRLVVQRLVRDIRTAYWKAVSAEVLEDRLTEILARAKEVNKHLEEEESRKSTRDTGPLLALQKRIYETMRDLMAERDALAGAKAELAALIGVAPNTKFELAATEGDVMSLGTLPALDAAPKDLEILALLIRPEMREQTLRKRVASRSVRSEVLETFPGISGLVGMDYDSNKFLGDSVWINGSLDIAGSLTKLFTLPLRLESAENREKLADMQRMAMAAAVMTGTHVATRRYDLAKDHVAVLKNLMGVNTRLVEYSRENAGKNDPLSAGMLLGAEMDMLLTRTRLHLAFADAQNAYGTVLTSLGLDPLPPGLEEKALPELSSMIAARQDAMTGEIITSLLAKIRENTDLLSQTETPQAVSSPTPLTPAKPAQRGYNS